MTPKKAVAEPFDVITVPDFAGAARHRFEARTLLFLASWMENAGTSRDLPIHVACIGEPPASVRQLAERAGAIVSVHEPLKLADARTANKLRGLEVQPKTERFLLLDTDIVFLGDISALQELPDGIAAAPGGGAKVPMALWRRLYAEIGLDFPEERMPLMRVELDLPPFPPKQRFDSQHAEMAESPPYYNSGVILASWKHDLRSLWAQCLESGARVVDASDHGSAGVLRSDQAGFALAVMSLRAQGIAFHRLPDSLHARWRHLYWGVPSPAEIRILHTTGMMSQVDSPGSFASGRPEPLEAWCEQTRSLLSGLRWADMRRGRVLTGMRCFRKGRARTQELQERLLAIYHHQIEGVI